MPTFNQCIKRALDNPQVQADNGVMIYREGDEYSWYPTGPSSRPWVNLLRFGMDERPPVPDTWMLDEQTPDADTDAFACDDERVIGIAVYGDCRIKEPRTASLSSFPR